MARFRLAQPARVDLAAILETSQERWGELGRRRYTSLLTAALRLVAADPESPLTRDRADLAPGVRSLHVKHASDHGAVHAPVHVLYFRIARPGMLEILRVLHERVEPSVPLHARRAKRRPGRR